MKTVLRLCSLRNVFALLAGGVLTLLPVVPGPASSAVTLLPYVPRYPHQAYGYQLALTRLQHNGPGREWLAAADRALWSPQSVEVPLAVVAELVAPSPANSEAAIKA